LPIWPQFGHEADDYYAGLQQNQPNLTRGCPAQAFAGMMEQAILHTKSEAG
jgi:hypothetical protein